MVMLELPDWAYLTAAAALSIGAALLMYWGLLADPSRGRRRCPKCWYEIGEVKTLCCPECGRLAKRERHLYCARRRYRLVLLGIGLMVFAFLASTWPAVRIRGPIGALPTIALAWAFEPTGLTSRSLQGLIRDNLQSDLENGRLPPLLRRWLARRVLDATPLEGPRHKALDSLQLVAACGPAVEEAWPRVQRFLESPHAMVREEAIFTLLRIGFAQREARQLIAEAMLSDSTLYSVRIKFIRAIPTSEAGAMSLVPVLIRIMNEKPHPIFEYFDPETGDPAESSDSFTYDTSHKFAAINALGHIGPRAAAALPAMAELEAEVPGDDLLRNFLVCAREAIEGSAQSYTDAWANRLTSDNPKLVQIAASAICAATEPHSPQRESLSPEVISLVRTALQGPLNDSAKYLLLIAAIREPTEFAMLIPEIRVIADDDTQTNDIRNLALQALQELDRPK